MADKNEPTLVHIENGGVSADVSREGAELRSIVRDGTEYLWQGDARWWGRRAPVLFPIVGRLRDDHAVCAAGETTMKQHGVARLEDFELVAATDSECIWRLVDNESTRAVFPYAFALDVSYHIDEAGVLGCTFSVQNTGDAALPFVVGGHPAFNVPMDADHVFEDYELVFREPWNAESPSMTADGLLDYGNRFTVLNDAQILPLTHRTFDVNTLVFNHVPYNTCELRDKDDRHGVRVDFPGFDWFGVWSAADDAPFVALEPWCGCATCLDEDDTFENKRGMVSLEPGETFSRTFTITVR
jgi:galactose mutarotase-like enzyme